MVGSRIDILLYFIPGFICKIHYSYLSSFTSYNEFLSFEINILNIERNKFRNTKSSGIYTLHYRHITNSLDIRQINLCE